MCNSVLSHRQVDLVSKFVTKAKQGDVGGAYMGQDARLLWAQPGLKKFEEELKKLKQKPQENQPVTSDFLEKHPNVYKEGLRKGWFRKEDPQEMSTSLVETGDSTCEAKLQKMKGNQEHCMDQTWTKVLNACFQAAKWQISDKPDPDEIDHQCQVNMTNPDVNKPKRVGTPDECLTVDFGNEEPFKWRFFYLRQWSSRGRAHPWQSLFVFSGESPVDEDFDWKKLNEFDHFTDFRDYIYWETAQVEKS